MGERERTVEILLETKEYYVAVKPPKYNAEQTADKSGFADLLAEKNGGYIGVIHRLDKGVGGVTVYARNRESAAKLSQAVQDRSLKKEYLAVLSGSPEEPCGELRDLLFYDRGKNKVFAVRRQRKGVKEAILGYRVLQTLQNPRTGEAVTLVSVELVTGRTHQIRAQFSSRGLPLLGDRRYGGKGDTGIALWCRKLELPKVGSSAAVCVEKLPEGEPWNLFDCLQTE